MGSIPVILSKTTNYIIIPQPNYSDRQIISLKVEMKFNSRIIKIFEALLLFTMSTNAFSSASSQPPSTTSATSLQSKENNHDETANTEEEEVLALPAGDPNNEDVPVLQFGEKMAFDHLGPIIINADGSTRQIANWNELTKQEQEVSWRRISKRNEERRKALLEKQNQEEEKPN